MSCPIRSWSPAAADRCALMAGPAPADARRLPIGGRFHRLVVGIADAGTLVLRLRSPRPLRLSVAGAVILDEPLTSWRFARRLDAAVTLPVGAGDLEITVESGERPHHDHHVDRECPSRNRVHVLSEVARRLPDQLEVLACDLVPGIAAPALGLRFQPTQFRRDGLTWQEVVVRPVVSAPPGHARHLGELAPPAFHLGSELAPGAMHEDTPAEERAAGLRRCYVPVFAEDPAPLRRTGAIETRIEPVIEEVGTTRLLVEGGSTAVAVPMPVYEPLGRLAPVRAYRALVWPAADDAVLDRLPRPILPPDKPGWERLHDEAWRMLLRLVRTVRPESGVPGGCIGTGSGFGPNQFVWDTSFTTLALAYGHRVLPATAGLDVLYSRQFDGGYLHREHDLRDGQPIMYEPDFGPNPPLMAVAELAVAALTGDRLRLKRVYPALAAHHRWITANRRLPDGSFWTTGLANGLDNSPNLGDGYVCLTAQMVHHADCLAQMARILGEDPAPWESDRTAFDRALNDNLWSDQDGFYLTSLAAGGFNPNKAITGFWPLWAGAAPAARIDRLVAALTDERLFWREHPVPTLAADSPYYEVQGRYWRGSVWCPTNTMVIKGLQRAGRGDLARRVTERHLDAMAATFERTGRIWENYLAEGIGPGGIAMPDYCWSATPPIALLYESYIGLTADAIHRRLRWEPPAGQRVGVQRLPLGPATVHLIQRVEREGDRLEMVSDFPVIVTVVRGGIEREVRVGPGRIDLSM